MFYFLYGDSNRTFERARALTNSLLKKKPHALVFKINSDNYSHNLVTELIGGIGLFENKYIVNMSRILENPNLVDSLFEFLPELQESDNVFIWVEQKVLKPQLKKIEKYATKIEDVKGLKEEVPKMNIFDLANAFVEGDKKKIWILYQKALMEYSPEEIYGALWWQIKTIILASKTKTSDEAGMKDFPYKKAKGYLRNFEGKKIEKIALDLIIIYHQSRLDSENLSVNLEKFLISV